MAANKDADESNRVELRNLQNALDSTKTELTAYRTELNDAKTKILEYEGEITELKSTEQDLSKQIEEQKAKNNVSIWRIYGKNGWPIRKMENMTDLISDGS